MKKLDKPKEMRDFILNATDEDFMSYIGVYSFERKMERSIYLNRNTVCALAYLQKFGFDKATRCQIFKDNQLVLVKALLDWAKETKSKSIFQEFLMYGHYEAIMAFSYENEEFTYPEQELFNAHRQSLLLKQIKTVKLSSFAKLRVIMEGDNVLIRTMFDSSLQTLDVRAEDAFFAHTKQENVEYWLKQRPFHRKHQLWQQKYLIRFGTKEQLEELINTRQLKKGAEEFFFRCAPFELVARYIKMYQPEKGEKYLFRYGKHADVMFYLHRNTLSNLGEHCLLKRGHHEEIMLFIDNQYFCDENEVQFINRGIDSEIAAYLRYHSLCDLAQLALVKGGNVELITYFVNHYPLADIALEELMRHPRLRFILYPWLLEND